ncbi:MAG: diacylglycerol kinase family protein [Desulfuromonadales bacterium]
MPKIKLIANPVAGRRAPAKIRAAENWLRQNGADVDLTLTRARGDARAAAADARHKDFHRIIAAGGDGTLNEVINGLAPSPIPLGFLPLGTTNVFALEAGIPFAVEAACAIALAGEVRPICLGMAGESRFLLMAGIGFDADVVYGINLRLKRLVGKLAYLAGGFAALWRRAPLPVEVETEDGRVYRGFNTVIGNGRLYGGGFSLTPQASLTANRLDLCLLLRPGRFSLLRCAAGFAAGRPPGPQAALCLQGREFTVRGGQAPVQIDGDYLGRLPMTFRAVFGDISMVFPPPGEKSEKEGRG